MSNLAQYLESEWANLLCLARAGVCLPRKPQLLLEAKVCALFRQFPSISALEPESSSWGVSRRLTKTVTGSIWNEQIGPWRAMVCFEVVNTFSSFRSSDLSQSI